jgi:2-oxoglutarate ferredoxin oxidoreductase subunit gamma
VEERCEILLAGSGGQGLGLAGVILAQALAEEEGKNVVETEAYGISMRGGHSRSEVIMSTGEINELSVTEPDILLALSQEAAELFIHKVKKGGVILLDPAYVKDIPKTEARVLPLAFTEEATNLGRATMANVIALGAIAAVTSILSKVSLENTLGKKFGPPQREQNLRALARGYELVGKKKPR